ncbi:MAG: trypsin-like peptidase domain-containing protein [Bacteriovorax sp.]|nr:trypsin-like peptidase domain-containing protein [Bacteriovorax sp.]
MKIITGLMLLALSFHLIAADKVVYGDDDRKDIYDSPNPIYKILAVSTAAMISNLQVSLQTDGTSNITGGTLEEDGVCSDARFAKQMVAANCSGFLVGENLLVTAGHCIQSMNDCGSYKWVFGFSNDAGEKSSYSIPAINIYTCTKIISRTLDRNTMNDYALVQLDRKVERRAPLKFRTSGKISDTSGIVVIGHPSGLPTKISDGANVRDNKNKYFFQGNLDTFGGNSGSAVFDTKTGLVEGILVRGERDYEGDPVQNCTRPKVCKMNECRGEDVTRITNIKELKSFNR